MNCRRYACLIAALLVLPALVLADLRIIPFVSFDEAMAQSKRDGKLLFVYFGRYGCGTAEKTNREAFVNPEVKERYTSHYVLAYVDAESGRRLRLPSGERVPEARTGTRYDAPDTGLHLHDPEGKLVLRLVGVQRIEDLINADDRIQAALAKVRQP